MEVLIKMEQNKNKQVKSFYLSENTIKILNDKRKEIYEKEGIIVSLSSIANKMISEGEQ